MSGDFRLHQMLKNDYHICTFVTLFRFITMLCGTDIIMWNIPYITWPPLRCIMCSRDFLSILFLNFLAEQEAINLVTTKVNSVKAIILHFILHKLDKLLVSSRPIPSSLSCMHTKFEVKPTHTQRISSSLLSLSFIFSHFHLFCHNYFKCEEYFQYICHNSTVDIYVYNELYVCRICPQNDELKL